MPASEKTGEAARQALVSLRKKLGKTQQSFAVEILKTAITTVARYETSHPPRGEVLLRLANISADHGFFDLREEFRFIYLDEVAQNLGFNLIVDRDGSKDGPRGYLILKLQGQSQIDDAIDLLRKRRGPAADADHRNQLEKALLGYGKKAE